MPGDKAVVVIVRVLTDRGKSRWSPAVRVPMTDSVKTTTTDQRIDLVDQDGVISVAATQAVAGEQPPRGQDRPHRQQRWLHRDAVLPDRRARS